MQEELGNEAKLITFSNKPRVVVTDLEASLLWFLYVV